MMAFVGLSLSLFVAVTQAFMFGDSRVRDPPAICIVGFEYCKFACPGCPVCHNNLIKCSEAIFNYPFAPIPDVFKDSCLTELDKCRKTCARCHYCYPNFLDCKEREMYKSTTTPAVSTTPSSTTPMPITTKSTEPLQVTEPQLIPIQMPSPVQVEVNAQGPAQNVGISQGQVETSSTVEPWPPGVEIGIPGSVIFVIDESVDKTSVQKLNEDGTIVDVKGS